MKTRNKLLLSSLLAMVVLFFIELLRSLNIEFDLISIITNSIIVMVFSFVIISLITFFSVLFLTGNKKVKNITKQKYVQDVQYKSTFFRNMFKDYFPIPEGEFVDNDPMLKLDFVIEETFKSKLIQESFLFYNYKNGGLFHYEKENLYFHSDKKGEIILIGDNHLNFPFFLFQVDFSKEILNSPEFKAKLNEKEMLIELFALNGYFKKTPKLSSSKSFSKIKERILCQ